MTEPAPKLVVGVDPGLTTGLAALRYLEQRRVADPICVQIHGHEGVEPFVRSLIERRGDGAALLSVETFVVGARSARSSSAKAGKVTRSLIGALEELASATVQVVSWNAAQVKTWTTDKRLQAAGLLAPTTGMRHARDAARHALYAAVKTGLTDDPSSSRTVRS